MILNFYHHDGIGVDIHRSLHDGMMGPVISGMSMDMEVGLLAGMDVAGFGEMIHQEVRDAGVLPNKEWGDR